jgi:hypothetical protein
MIYNNFWHNEGKIVKIKAKFNTVDKHWYNTLRILVKSLGCM